MTLGCSANLPFPRLRIGVLVDNNGSLRPRPNFGEPYFCPFLRQQAAPQRAATSRNSSILATKTGSLWPITPRCAYVRRLQKVWLLPYIRKKKPSRLQSFIPNFACRGVEWCSTYHPQDLKITSRSPISPIRTSPRNFLSSSSVCGLVSSWPNHESIATTGINPFQKVVRST